VADQHQSSSGDIEAKMSAAAASAQSVQQAWRRNGVKREQAGGSGLVSLAAGWRIAKKRLMAA